MIRWYDSRGCPIGWRSILSFSLRSGLPEFSVAFGVFSMRLGRGAQEPVGAGKARGWLRWRGPSLPSLWVSSEGLAMLLLVSTVHVYSTIVCA